MRGSVLFVLLLLLVPLVPSAGADHVYSHRYVVYARVVDGQDRPVPGVAVDLDFPETVEGTCNPQAHNATEYFGNTITRNVSDANGFVIFCEHVHALSPDAPARATLSALGRAVTWTADFETRMDHETLVLADAVGVEPLPGLVVAARIWRASEAQTLIEGIPVYGDTVKGVNVTVAGRTSVTNNYGDVSMLVDDMAADTLRVLNDTFPLVREHGWAHAKVREPALPPDLTLRAAKVGATCWWETPRNLTRNPDAFFTSGRAANVLLDPAGQDVTFVVGQGSLAFSATDGPIILPLAQPPTNTTTYGCQPGAVPSGHLTWGAAPAQNGTTTTPTPATTAPIAKGTPGAPLALAVGILALAALLRPRR